MRLLLTSGFVWALSSCAPSNVLAQDADSLLERIFAELPEMVGNPCPRTFAFPRSVLLIPANLGQPRVMLSQTPGPSEYFSVDFNKPPDSLSRETAQRDTIPASLAAIRCQPATQELRFTLRYGSMIEIVSESDVPRVVGGEVSAGASAIMVAAPNGARPLGVVYPCGNLTCPSELRDVLPDILEFRSRESRERDSMLAARRREVAENERRIDSTTTAERMKEARAQRERVNQLRARGWTRRTIDAVVAHKVFVGMTEEMVRESWGPPGRVNSTTTATGTSEQWVYGDDYVYLVNGRVTAIQTTR